MEDRNQLPSLPDDALLRRMTELTQRSRGVEVELIAHIGEVDERRLYARRACSMFSFCTQVLHMAEHEAYLRIKVARASREHPVLLDMLADGRLYETQKNARRESRAQDQGETGCLST